MDVVADTKTEGELLFEKYLEQHSLKFEFHKRFPNKRKKPDYSVPFDGREFLFDVKDFASKEFPEFGGYYDPIGPIRLKIDAAQEKFQEYKEYPCGLVLYNEGAPLVHLSEPIVVFGAMFGNPGFTTPIDTSTGTPTGPTEQAFLSGGKMIHSRRKKPRIAHISAVITLRRINIGHMRLEQYIDGLPESRITDASESAVALWEHLQSAQLPFDQSEMGIGVIVWQNVFAKITFPSEIFCGPYDIHWTGVDGRLIMTFEGQELKALKTRTQSASG